jgi:hypothetical protein
VNADTFDYFAITFDVDWAPEPAIRMVADLCREAGIKSTWFVTHPSEALREMANEPELFELGLHPNFLPGTTQGSTDSEVLAYGRSLVHNARSLRTHALVQSTHLMRLMAGEFGIRNDVSLFLSETPNLVPHSFYPGDDLPPIVRLPFFWEDDLQTFVPDRSWDIGNARYHVPGLKIFNFHPLFVYLNMDKMADYDKLKSGGKPLNALISEEMAPAIHEGAGTLTLLKGLLAHMRDSQGASFTVSEMGDAWREFGKTNLHA